MARAFNILLKSPKGPPKALAAFISMEYFTSKQLIEKYGFTLTSIRNKVQHKKIPFDKKGNRLIFYKYKIEKWLEIMSNAPIKVKGAK